MDFNEFKKGLESEVRHDSLQASVMGLRQGLLRAVLVTAQAPTFYEAVEIWLAANDGDISAAIQSLRMHRDFIDEYLIEILKALLKRIPNREVE